MSSNEPDFWHNKWKTGDIRFHQKEAHPDLVKYFSEKGARNVFVPLCGKTLDMVWLAEQGHWVTGVELSPLGCSAFFAENNIPFQKRSEPNFEVYKSDKIEIWNGDFFKTPDSVWRKIDFVYDRAALVALPTELRNRYAKLFAEKVPQATLLVIVVEYAQEKLEGPAFSISEEEVMRLYGATYGIEKLLTKENPPFFKSNPKYAEIDVKEVTYRMKPID